MTGVADIVRQKAYNDFEQWIFRLAIKKGATTRHNLARLIYGNRPDGKPANTSVIYNTFGGKQKPSPKTIQLWAEKLGTTPAAIKEHFPDAHAKIKPLLPIIASHSLPFGEVLPTPAMTNDQFSMVVDSEGKVAIRLNVQGLPMDKAMRIISALTGAGVLGNGE